MFDLVVGLHRLRAGGKRIDVVLFSGAKDEAQRARYAGLPSQGPHEAAQAENIRTAAQAKRYDHVLVLTGSVHARKSPVERRGPAFLPMAMQLAPANETTSFRLLNGAGTSWDCQLKPGTTFKPGSPVPNDAMDCDNHPTRGEVALNGPPFAALGMPTGYTAEGAYDGYVWLGPVTGSAPAVP